MASQMGGMRSKTSYLFKRRSEMSFELLVSEGQDPGQLLTCGIQPR